jgi:hypothetical protein
MGVKDYRLGRLPVTVFSHQSIVLPLKIRYPQLFDGTALCIGSMMPDLDLVLPGFRAFHALESVVLLLPLALLFVFLFDTQLAPYIALTAQQPRPGRIARLLMYCGMDTWSLLAAKRFSFRWLFRASYSAIIGILSHFLLDLPTHHWITYFRPFFEGPMPAWFLHSLGFVTIPFYGDFSITRARVLQWVFSVGLGLVTLYCLRYMKKQHLLEKWYQL